ncbi:serine/threonine protein kinase [Bacillus massilinigeriensis]|uniref:serine/threonine protein kinase n=1 Tax=Bacillus massilionigeriensis TaxID=1805475 RepID=UPI00096AF39B|nr:protein kinase [Bacillus massilionigeriensis]
MMNSSSKSLCNIIPGTIIEGKWHKNRFTIIKLLGSGANGAVYLVQFQNRQVALKISDNGMAITSEVNVLKSFQKVQGSTLGPSLIDVDDWGRGTKNIQFYVMEYIHGPDLLSFINKRGQSWTGVLILQLLSDLEKLHQNGWVFGDLKPENLIVTGPPSKIRCIDVGGTTIQGRAIKEFTEFYDRGYWGMGSRKAEPTYDLFAVAMIMINTAYPKRFPKTTGGIKQLKPLIKQKTELQKYERILLTALEGRYQSAKQMREDLLELFSSQISVSPDRTNQKNVQRKNSNQVAPANQKIKKKRRRKRGIIESFIILMIISFLYFLYIYEQIL